MSVLGSFSTQVHGKITELKGSFDTHAALTATPHGSTHIATANLLMIRDANARARVAAAPASDNTDLIANTNWVQGEIAGAGTVTSVGSGTGLSGGPITGAGTLSLANTAVAPNTYNFATITVDQQGRITSASTGAAALSSRNMIAGSGISGGGTLAADRTFTFAPSELVTMSVLTFGQNDGPVMLDGATAKVMPRDQMGLFVNTVGTGNTVFDEADANTCQVSTATGGWPLYEIPRNSTTAFFIGTMIMMVASESAGIQVDPAFNVTLNSVIALGSTVTRAITPGGTGCIIKISIDEWQLFGDIL